MEHEPTGQSADLDQARAKINRLREYIPDLERQLRKLGGVTGGEVILESIGLEHRHGRMPDLGRFPQALWLP